MRSNRQPFANRILAHGPDGVTTNSNANSAPAYREFWKSPASNRPPGGESFVDQIARASAGLALLPAGEAILVVHSGTIRAVLAIALDLAPDNALRFVIDPLSLTRIDRLENGWRVVAVNTCGIVGWAKDEATAHHLRCADVEKSVGYGASARFAHPTG